MGVPQLKMNKSDVETAIARTFKKNIHSLSFNRSQLFSNIDPDGHCGFTLQDKFDGEGTYRVNGHAKLWDASKGTSLNYRLETYVLVNEEEGAPVIQFNEVIFASKM